MRVAILGLGEAGRTFASAFLEADWSVHGYDPGPVDTPVGVIRESSIPDAVAHADLTLSFTTARFAVDAAREAAPALGADSLYVDLNAATPSIKAAASEAIGSAEGFVDGAVLGSVLQFGAGVHILLSGGDAERASTFIRQVGAQTDVVGSAIGAASQRKLIRSVFVKSLAALLAETMDAARTSGDETWLKHQVAEWLTNGTETIERLDHTTRLHAERRSHELVDSLSVLNTLGVQSSVVAGALDTHLRFAREQAKAGGLSAALAEIPTPALGDAQSRRGLLHSAISPVWDAPRVAGRAFTIETRPGDNQAIHQAIAEIKPGDLVMIDGGGHTERALIGDLIAERLRDAGAVGVVLDAAVRDPRGIAEVGLPTFARAVTPAGPYRNGPGRHRIPISIGGVVCQPGDYVVADEDGVIVIPALRTEEVLRGGQEKIASETRQREALQHRQASTS